MESIEDIIGVGFALQLTFNSRYRQLDAEDWHAILERREYKDSDVEPDEGRQIASARLVRVNLDSADWFDSLDAESGDLAAVGAAFHDRSAAEEVDPNSLFAGSLIVVDFVGVAEEFRGQNFSHAFLRGIANIFRNDIVALIPASISTDADGELYVDKPKREALTRHWKDGGFVNVPGTKVLLLPFSNR
jgi:hypothetical protein